MSRIELKSPREIEYLRENGRLLREAMDEIGEAVTPGVTTLELDRVARAAIERRGGKPAFLGLYGFPGTLCISVNEEVVHGIAGPRKLREGDIVSFDCGLLRNDFYSDMARTVGVGRIDEMSARLIATAKKALALGIEQLWPDKRLGDCSAAVQQYVEAEGFSVVREYTGHGIGRKLHEDPKIPNHGKAGTGVRWKAGMVVCVEPMVNVGTHRTRVLDDDWTVVTADGERSAHVEHMIAISEDGPEILT